MFSALLTLGCSQYMAKVGLTHSTEDARAIEGTLLVRVEQTKFTVTFSLFAVIIGAMIMYYDS